MGSKSYVRPGKAQNRVSIRERRDMMAEFSAKLKRQVQLLVAFGYKDAILSLNVIQKNVPTNIRTLQRDIKELSEAGFLKAYYDRAERRYRGKINIVESFDEFPPEKRKHYQMIEHFLDILWDMECLTPREVEYSLDIHHRNRDLYEFWIEEGKIDPKPVPDDIMLDRELGADKVYFKMFPGAEQKDFERDLRFLEEIGYPIRYDEELDVYYKDISEFLKT